MVLPLEINTQKILKCRIFITDPKLTNICEIFLKFQTTHITCYDDSKLYHHIFSVRSMSLGIFFNFRIFSIADNKFFAC